MSYNLVDPTTGDLTQVAGGIDTSIIPSNASASNKLVTHQVPYELFTLNNNSGSQKWYKLGKYEEGNYTARLDFVSARVDGQMFESSVRISGIGNDNNYVSWIGEKGCEISIITVKADSARNLYIKMNSYSAVEIRVYGTFTLDIVEQSSEPSGIQIVLNTLATMDKVNALYKQTVGYIEGSLLSSAIEYANLYYQKFGDNKLVINGWISLGSAVPTQSTKIFTLPNGCKADSNYLLPCYTPNSNSAYACMIDIGTSDVESYTPLPSGVELRFCGTIYLQ